jgi:lipopolysaccharide export system permease protein
MSIITLVQIAALTSIITINFGELTLLYAYKIPYISFYTLSVSFFISLCITIAKLSSESELIVITSFGLNPFRIITILLPILLLFTMLILIVSIGLIPKTRYLAKSFIQQKKVEAKFNIKASEFGQSFGEWLIYIEKDNNNLYEKVKLYKNDPNYDKFILSDSAVLNNKDGNLNLILHKGKSFTFEKKQNLLEQVEFDKMYMNDSLSEVDAMNFTTSYHYWMQQYKTSSRFSFYILISIFPLISIFFVMLFGYYNPRYDKNRAVMWSIITTGLYFIIVTEISKLYLVSLYILPSIWLIVSYSLYRYKVRRKF